jgi:hypothetical protein
MNPAAWLHKARMRLYVRPCRGCDESSPHDSHLTRLGRRRFAGGR